MPSLGPNSDVARQRLVDLRNSLLKLHKILLDSERASYHRLHGRVTSTGEFFQLVIGDDWFAWLRRLSERVAQIDEALDADEPLTAIEAARLIDQTRQLLKPNEEGEGFAKRYFEALQQNPDVVLAHAAVKRVLRKGVFQLN